MNTTFAPATRRRFLSIAASAATCLAFGVNSSNAAAMTSWKGIALGAGASLRLSGMHSEDAERVIAGCLAELSRLEDIFSLYRTDSALSRLNRDGVLQNPPAEMLELLGLCGAINAETQGKFDPTVQPIWEYHAARAVKRVNGNDRNIHQVLKRTGWKRVAYGPSEIRFLRGGMAITLNGIAQGYISDRICAFLRDRGFNHALVDMGEISAIGAKENGEPWRVGIADPVDGSIAATLEIKDRAVATSSPIGTLLRPGVGHVFDPHTAYAGTQWRHVTVTAPRAALADGYSTAFCLMSRDDINRILRSRPELSVHLES